MKNVKLYVNWWATSRGPCFFTGKSSEHESSQTFDIEDAKTFISYKSGQAWYKKYDLPGLTTTIESALEEIKK